VTQGSRKGLARATQALHKGHPSVDLRFGLCFQQKLEKGRVGVGKIGSIPKIGISKSKSLTTKGTQEK
jgi:hypothetical protein